MNNYSKIRVVIADDHEIFRQGFKSMMTRQEELEVVGEAENGQALLEVISIVKPDLVISDIKMPVMDGVDATREIKKHYPDIKVIALSMFNDDNLIVDMLHAGASGYLLKDANQEEIVKASNIIFNGGKYYCRDTSDKINALIESNVFNPYKKGQDVRFSEREVQVIQLICEQLTTKEIAAKLDLSQRTIDTYRDTIQQKTQSKNMVGVALYAVKHGYFKV